MQSGAYSEGLPSDAVMMVANASWVQNAVEAALRQVVHPLGRFDILRDVQVCGICVAQGAGNPGRQRPQEASIAVEHVLIHGICCAVSHL